jgi:hypothetical protein
MTEQWEDEMQDRGRPLVMVAIAWTLLVGAIGIVLALEATLSLYDGQQACFFNYPAVACPAGDDPAVVRLTVAFFGVPLVWLVGIVLVIVAWARRSRRICR